MQTITPWGSQISSNRYCMICYQPYNQTDQKPLSVCSVKHVVCKECLITLRRKTCPFCRENISRETIRLNTKIVSLIKQREMERQRERIEEDEGEGKYRRIRRSYNVQRYITDWSVRSEKQGEEEQGSDYELLGETELREIGFGRRSANNENLNDNINNKCFRVWIWLLIFFLQLPFGVLNMYLINSKRFPCLNTEITDVTGKPLKSILLTMGYMQCMLPALLLYTCILTSLLERYNIIIVDLLLVLMQVAKDFVGFIVFSKFIIFDGKPCLHEEPTLMAALKWEMIASCVGLCLGIVLLCRTMDYVYRVR